MTKTQDKRFDVIREFKNQYGEIIKGPTAINLSAEECKRFIEINVEFSRGTVIRKNGKVHINAGTEEESVLYIVDHVPDEEEVEIAPRDEKEVLAARIAKTVLIAIAVAVTLILLAL